MPIQTIDIPSSIRSISLSDRVSEIIDAANDRIEAFLLANDLECDDFIPCDFHLFAQALDWILESDLPAPRRFCELGSGLGTVVAVAAERGLDSTGIEIGAELVEHANLFIREFNVDAKFYRASFVPRDAQRRSDVFTKFAAVDSDVAAVGDGEIPALSDFDLLFAYPWPHQQTLFEALLETYGDEGSLLLTYQGQKGMRLHRKT